MKKPARKGASKSASAPKPEPKPLTKRQLLALLKQVPESGRAALACSQIGHSRMVDGFFGYVYCGRCRAQIGDTLAGAFNGADVAGRHHGCDQCRENIKQFTWKDTLLMMSPEEWIKPREESDE